MILTLEIKGITDKQMNERTDIANSRVALRLKMCEKALKATLKEKRIGDCREIGRGGQMLSRLCSQISCRRPSQRVRNEEVEF